MCMKNLKKYLTISLIFVIFLININEVSAAAATYSANAGTAYNGGAVSNSCAGKTNCAVSSDSEMIIQAKMYYVNNGSFDVVGATAYFVDSDAYNILKDKGLNLIYVPMFNQYRSHEQAAEYLKSYFGSGARTTTDGINFLKTITGLQDYSEMVSNQSQGVGGTKGYRVVIEPAYRYANPTFGTNYTYALMTPKGLAAEKYVDGVNTTCLGEVNKQSICIRPVLGLNSQSQYLRVKSNDVGIEAASVDYCSRQAAISDIANKQIGCGYDMIDMSKYVIVKKCYSQKVNISNKNFSCKNYDENNVIKFTEEYKNDCNSTSPTGFNESGKYIAESGTCKIYCKESAQVSLPGNISGSIQRGSYFAWPTRPDDASGLYSMNMKSTLVCTIKDTAALAQTVGTELIMGCQENFTPYNRDTCRSITDKTEKICPFGTEERNGKCYKLANATKITDALTTEQVSKVCPSDGTYELIDNKCYHQVNPTSKDEASTSKVCPDGYKTNSGGTGDKACKKTVDNWVCPQYYSTNPGGSGDYACRLKKYKYYGAEYGSVDGGKSSICESVYGGWFVNGKYCNPYSDPCCKIPDGYWYKPKVNSPTTKYAAKKCLGGEDSKGNCKPYCAKGTAVKVDKKYRCIVCPSGYKVSSVAGKCVKKKNTAKVCPSGSSLNSSDNKCYKIVPPYCTKGTLMDVNFKYKCLTCPSGYSVSYINKGRCVQNSETAKVCPSGYVEVKSTGECYLAAKKNKPKFSCPSGYTMNSDQETCNKVCNKEDLVNKSSSVIISDETNPISASLVAGSNIELKKIEEPVKTFKETKDNVDIYTFERVAHFKIEENTNRYYDRLTGAVSNQGESSERIFDRGEGVISVSKTAKTYDDNGNIFKYKLQIKDINIGSGGRFGKLITNYSCEYIVTEDDDDCVCPNGTKNAGMSLNELTAKYCNNVNKTCSEWQYLLCDSPYSKILEIEGCTDKLYCNNTQTNAKINITDCVKKEADTKTLDKAINTCQTNQTECTNNWCYNQKNNKPVPIADCLSEGNSRETCYRKMGCTTDICEDGKCCTGTCKWSYGKTKDNTVTYGYQTCNNNRYCGFIAYCTNDSRKTSIHTNQCIQSKLKTTSITGYLNTERNFEKLKESVEACKSTICASSEKIVYRVVDLTNPFPGKDGIKNALTIVNANREPGYNWNSETAIKEQILNGRGASGYELYNKEPLITIKLTPSDIKAIKKYNETTPYNNFDMNCISGDSASGCISNFLHKNELNLDIDGVANCTNLNASSSIEQFNNCYNKEN